MYYPGKSNNARRHKTTYAFPIKIISGASYSLTPEVPVQALYNDSCNYNYISSDFATVHLGIKHLNESESESQLEGDCTLIWQSKGLGRYKQRTVFWIVPNAKFDILFGHDDEDFNPRLKNSNRNQFSDGVKSGVLKKDPTSSSFFGGYFRKSTPAPSTSTDGSASGDVKKVHYTLLEIQEQLKEQLECSEERKRKHEVRRAVNIWNPHVPASILFRKDTELKGSQVARVDETVGEGRAVEAETSIEGPAMMTEHVENIEIAKGNKSASALPVESVQNQNLDQNQSQGVETLDEIIPSTEDTTDSATAGPSISESTQHIPTSNQIIPDLPQIPITSPILQPRIIETAPTPTKSIRDSSDIRISITSDRSSARNSNEVLEYIPPSNTGFGLNFDSVQTATPILSHPNHDEEISSRAATVIAVGDEDGEEEEEDTMPLLPTQNNDLSPNPNSNPQPFLSRSPSPSPPASPIPSPLPTLAGAKASSLHSNLSSTGAVVEMDEEETGTVSRSGLGAGLGLGLGLKSDDVDMENQSDIGGLFSPRMPKENVVGKMDELVDEGLGSVEEPTNTNADTKADEDEAVKDVETEDVDADGKKSQDANIPVEDIKKTNETGAAAVAGGSAKKTTTENGDPDQRKHKRKFLDVVREYRLVWGPAGGSTGTGQH